MMESWKSFCNMHKTKDLSNIFSSSQVLQAQDARKQWLVGLHQQGQNMVMTLLKSLFSSYKYLIIVLESMPIKLLMEYLMAHLMHEMSKNMEKCGDGD